MMKRLFAASTPAEGVVVTLKERALARVSKGDGATRPSRLAAMRLAPQDDA
jgi:hypothetical protein